VQAELSVAMGVVRRLRRAFGDESGSYVGYGYGYGYGSGDG
jgi:hypothetical protein